VRNSDSHAQLSFPVPLPPSMVAPGQTLEHPLNRSIVQTNWQVHFSTIDDLGVVHDEEKTLLPE